MQLRYETGHTGEGYVRAQAWRDASLERCPNHPHGECSLARHGTYTRKTPPGTKIRRWYCPESHMTFSLLPDCLSARLPGELDDVEAVVAHAEGAASVSAAANALRRDPIGLRGRDALGPAPGAAGPCRPESSSSACSPSSSSDASPRWARCAPGSQTDSALVALRALTAKQLPALPAPLGFHPRRRELDDSQSAFPTQGGG